MPIDQASATVIIEASMAEVFAAVRDVSSQAEWVREVSSVELLEEYEDGTPATARFAVKSPIGDDHYTLEYEHGDDEMTWRLVDGGMQKAQNGSYRLVAVSPSETEVTFSLTIDHSIAAPGFIRKKIFGGLVQNTLAGLKKYVEG